MSDPLRAGGLQDAARGMARTIGHGGSATLLKVAEMIDKGRGHELSYVSAECLRMLARDFDAWEKTARGLGNVITEDRIAFDAELRELRRKVEAQRPPMHSPYMLVILDEDPDSIGVELALDLLFRQDGDPVR